MICPHNPQSPCQIIEQEISPQHYSFRFSFIYFYSQFLHNQTIPNLWNVAYFSKYTIPSSLKTIWNTTIFKNLFNFHMICTQSQIKMCFGFKHKPQNWTISDHTQIKNSKSIDQNESLSKAQTKGKPKNKKKNPKFHFHFFPINDSEQTQNKKVSTQQKMHGFGDRAWSVLERCTRPKFQHYIIGEFKSHSSMIS